MLMLLRILSILSNIFYITLRFEVNTDILTLKYNILI
jgi:hypothetical protein